MMTSYEVDIMVSEIVAGALCEFNELMNHILNSADLSESEREAFRVICFKKINIVTNNLKLEYRNDNLFTSLCRAYGMAYAITMFNNEVKGFNNIVFSHFEFINETLISEGIGLIRPNMIEMQIKIMSEELFSKLLEFSE